MKSTSLVRLSVGLLLIGVAIPLILEKVPPNRWYGFRVAKTFSSESIWYAANRVAGYDLLLSGIVVAITAVFVGLFWNRLGFAIANTINWIVFVGALLVAVAHSFWYLNRL